YFHPFFASIIPLKISYMNQASTEALLARPVADFALDYTPEALDYVYQLAAGQPYVVQLIGFLLVRQHNERVSAKGEAVEPRITQQDVQRFIEEPTVFENGRY